MENQTIRPSTNISPQSTPQSQTAAKPLPPLKVSSDAQIFIHPEHEAGTLAVPQQNAKPQVQKKHDLLLISLSLLIGFLLVVGSAIFFILIPRSQNVSFANSIKDVVSYASEKTDKLNSSLEVLYKAITAQAEDVTLSHNTDYKFIVVETDKFLGFLDAVYKLVERTKDNLNKEVDVKSFAVPAGDPNQEARKHRELATDISKKAESAQELNTKLKTINNKSVPEGSQELKDEASKLEKTTTDYINESINTSEYYVEISQASIDLVTLASSIYSAKDIENAISKLTSLKTKFAEYEKAKLPEGIENYNKDIVETFDLLIKLYEDVKNGKFKTEAQILNAYTDFINDLSSISIRMMHDEISFWQNNKTLNSFKDLADKQTEIQKQAEEVKDSNNFFLLEWAGIS